MIHREIAKKLGISTSAAHLWTKGITLSFDKKEKIKRRWYKKFSKYYTKERRERLRELAKLNLSPYFYKKQYRPEDLLNQIKEFYFKHERIPLKREFGSRRIFRSYFGSWNKAIKLAGFEPNQFIFSSKRLIAKDGHACDSYAEQIIDDWLYRHNISHKRSVYYPNEKMTADFAIGSWRIEYFGLAGVIKSYD